MPRLSLILCSRNDEYMGHSRWRLETSLNYVAQEASALGLGPDDLEVLVADWGSDIPLHDVVTLTPAAHGLTRFVHVPPAVARARQGASPFPEVLALNAAARRARGDFIGRIDQDTLVGSRFLQWFFTASPDPSVLYFANRRELPYRCAAALPHLATLTRLIAERGGGMPVLRENPFTGHLYWTSSVGIWLASRDVWHEAAGYDERLIFYNWMETDMIHRLRARHPIVDLGLATDWDFYHLEHYHPLRSWASRPHALKNPDVDLSTDPIDPCPSGTDWGLVHEALDPLPPSSQPAMPRPARIGSYGVALLRISGWSVLDGLIIACLRARTRLAARLARVRDTVDGRPVTEWPGIAAHLWTNRAAARAARIAGWTGARHAVASVLASTGLLRLARRARLRLRLAMDREFQRLAAADRARFRTFKATHSHLWPAPVAERPERRALVISTRCPSIDAELATLTAVRQAGFTVTVLLEDEKRELAAYYAFGGAVRVCFWGDYLPKRDYTELARRHVDQHPSLEGLMQVMHDGVRCGRIAACTALRDLQLGVIDPATRTDRAALVRRLAASLAATEQARMILDTVDPQLVLTDHEYTPRGELFETCLARGLDVIAYDSAHRQDALVFKRYHAGNRDRHLTTLAPGTWANVQRMPWTPDAGARVSREIAECYERGDWYRSGIARTGDIPADTRAFLDLAPGAPVAAVFPHVLWDAPVLWGEPLFRSYQEWFVRTMRVAYDNPRVTWLVKLHPSHVWRQAFSREPEEVRVLRTMVGPIPSHVRLIPAHTPLATHDLLGVVDCCITVRGTVGIEAARLGLPVLTAGQARYTHHGFTVDSATAGEYLDRLRHIESIPPLNAEARTLAGRFAYGAFLLRPWRMTSIVPRGDEIDVRIADRHAWASAPDIRDLAAWFVSSREDYLAEPIPS